MALTVTTIPHAFRAAAPLSLPEKKLTADCWKKAIQNKNFNEMNRLLGLKGVNVNSQQFS